MRGGGARPRSNPARRGASPRYRRSPRDPRATSSSRHNPVRRSARESASLGRNVAAGRHAKPDDSSAGCNRVPTLGSLIDSPSRNAAGGPQQLGCVSSGRAGQLPSQTAAVRARCERTAVQRGWVTFHAMAEFASVMPILSVRVRWGSGCRLGLQAGGHRFDPGTLHNEKTRLLGGFLASSVASGVSLLTPTRRLNAGGLRGLPPGTRPASELPTRRGATS